MFAACFSVLTPTHRHTQINTNKISTVCTMQDQLAAQNASCICLAHQQQQLRCVSRTHSLPRTWAETWCWCQRSLNPAGWSPWLQRLCGHGDRQQRGDRTAGWGAAARAKWEKEECAPRERGREGRGREGERDAGWAASDADVAAVCCRTCVFVCVRASGVHETECVCVCVCVC